VTCTPACALGIDGRAAHERSLDRFEVFVEPGTHQLVASWGAGRVERELTAVAGAEESIAFEEPLEEAEEEEEIEDGITPQPVPVAPAPPPSSSGVHPGIFGALAGLAVVGLGVTIWSGVDTLDAAAAYRAAPTQARYNDGIGRELRTNVLIGVTSAVALTAAVLLFFTDWDGDAPADHAGRWLPSLAISTEGAELALSGRF
jgi:hypothetical protein